MFNVAQFAEHVMILVVIYRKYIVELIRQILNFKCYETESVEFKY